MKKMIKLDMSEYKHPVKRCSAEKIARIRALAEKLNVKIIKEEGEQP